MAYLLHIGMALLAQVAWEAGLVEASPRFWLVSGLLCVPHFLGALANRSFLRGRFRAAERWLRLLGWSPVVLHALAVLGGGWVELVETWLGRPARWMDWPHPALLLTLLPFLLYSLAAIDARTRLGSPPRTRARTALRFQTRLLLASLLPIAGYVLVSAAIGAIPNARLHIETVAVWNAAYAGAMLVVFAAGVPWLLRNTWETEPMPAGVERGLLEDVARLAGFRCRQLFVWRTGNSVSNAAIIGLYPRQRVVLFSDLLLAQLDLRELASVFAHEIGHAKKNHVVIFAAWAFAALFAGDLVATRYGGEGMGGAAVLLGALALWAIAFGWMSRRFELEADLFSLRLLGDSAPLIRALEQVSGVHGLARTSWRHFSTERRIGFLQKVAVDPAEGVRFERRLRWVAWTGIAAFVLVMGLEGVGLAGQWPRDHVLLALRQGDYAEARERAAGQEDVDPGLAELVARTGELEAGDMAELEARARAAIAAGDLTAAGHWLDLGALRGDMDMARAQSILVALQEEPRPWAQGLRSAAPEAWKEALEPVIQAFGAP